MSFQFVSTQKAPAAIGPYSQALKAGPFVFVSGQIGLEPESAELVSTDFESQARQALENMKQILTAAGTTLDQVVSVEIYLTHMGLFSTLNEIYGGFFGSHRPARAVIEVKGLPKGASIEVKCMAYTAD